VGGEKKQNKNKTTRDERMLRVEIGEEREWSGP
jgi:hypothetical protein